VDNSLVDNFKSICKKGIHDYQLPIEIIEGVPNAEDKNLIAYLKKTHDVVKTDCLTFDYRYTISNFRRQFLIISYRGGYLAIIFERYADFPEILEVVINEKMREHLLKCGISIIEKTIKIEILTALMNLKIDPSEINQKNETPTLPLKPGLQTTTA
jgi:hypothetical protein